MVHSLTQQPAAHYGAGADFYPPVVKLHDVDVNGLPARSVIPVGPPVTVTE